MYLYLLLNIASISIPLLYSFNKKMYFIKHWKAVFTSIIIIGLGFIVWDVIFTAQGIWGFNEEYHSPIKILGLPIEEWLFFICIPYASIFIHYALAYFYPKLLIPKNITRYISIAFLVLLIITVAKNTDKLYTLINFTLTIICLVISLYKTEQAQRFYISFLIILIPFCFVNGVLTGSFIPEPVVWYNNEENLALRLFTIPIEDIGYAFSLLFLNLVLIDRLKSKTEKE